MTSIRRALVVGAGSAGRRHLRNLRRLFPEATLVSWRVSHAPADAELAALADRVVLDEASALASGPELAIIAGPAPTHARTAEPCLRAGIPVLVEKPLAAALEDADRIVEAAEAGAVPLLVGYTLRFHPLLVALAALTVEGSLGQPFGFRAEVGQHLADWRPGTDWRKGVSARRELGGGVLLELSHEIDYARWLMGEISTIGAVTFSGALALDVEESADIICRFASGATGSLHLDVLQRPMVRSCRIMGSGGTAELDLVRQTLRCSDEHGRWREVSALRTFDRNDMFLEELGHFVACAAGITPPRVSARDGRRVLALALAARQAAHDGSMVNV